MKLYFNILFSLYLLTIEYIFAQNPKRPKESTPAITRAFELKGKILSDGKPLVGVSIGTGIGHKTYECYSSVNGEYNLMISPVIFQNHSNQCDVYYFKSGFIQKHLVLDPFITAKTDTGLVIFDLQVEMVSVGNKADLNATKDTTYFSSFMDFAIISWSKSKHRFTFKWHAAVEQISKEASQKEFTPKIGEKVTLKNVFFETDKSQLLPNSYEELNKLVDYLSKNKKISIQIMGHTDSTGTEEKNETLSTYRAKAVVDYLISKAMDKSRITYKGYGSSRPIARNDTDHGKQQNRSVEFILSKR